MLKFEFIEHTADMQFVAYGKTIDECFENAALALFTGILGEQEIKENFKKEGKIEGENLENLLHDFLSELIFIFETENLVFKKFKVKVEKLKNKEENKFCLNFSAYGDRSENYEIYASVKGVTYHNLNIEYKNKIYCCNVLCDV